MHETPASAGWGPCTFLPGPARALVRRRRCEPSVARASHIDCVRLRGPRTSAHTVIGSPCRQAGRGARWRMATQNASGVAKIGRGVAFRPGAGGGPDTGMAGEARARPLTPPMPHGEGSMAIPAMSPTSRDAAVTPTAANVPLPREPAPGSAPAGPRSAMSRMPKEPESRRNPGESARAAPSLVRHAGPPAGEPVHAMRAGEGRASRRSSKTEGTREPRQSWGLRAGGAANEPCLAGMCHGSGAPNPRTFSGCGLTSAEAQPLSAPAVRPWTR